MAEPNRPDQDPSPARRAGQKFRYSQDSQQLDPAREYPLSRREDEMSPEEVEAYLASQIDQENADKEFAGSRGRSASLKRRRPDQDFPELRTLRRWSLVSRWWMRTLGEGLYRFVTLDWNIQEGVAALSEWRPTQQSLWRFSTFTGAISIVLTLVLFWHFRQQKPALPTQGLLTAAASPVTEAGEANSAELTFSNDEEIAPVEPKPLQQVRNESPPSFDDEEPRQLAMIDPVPPVDTPHNFAEEDVITPRPPQTSPPTETLSDDPIIPVSPSEPTNNEFQPPQRVNRSEGFDLPVEASQAEATSTTRIQPDVPTTNTPSLTDKTEKTSSPFEEDDSEKRSSEEEPAEPVVQKLDPLPTEEFTTPRATQPAVPPEITEVRPEPRATQPPADPVPALPPTDPAVPATRRETDPIISQPSSPRQRVSIARSGSWDADQKDAAIYSMTIRNLDLQELAHLEIVESLPKGARFVSASMNGAYDPNSHTVRWVISSLLSQKAVQLSVRVQPGQNQSSQTSRVQVSDNTGIVGDGSWQVSHAPCQPASQIVPTAYESFSAEDDYFFGW